MKKVLLGFTLLFISLSVSAQQAQFGLTAGYLNINGKEKNEQNNVSISANNSGFYIGALADIALSEVFHVQPEVIGGFVDETQFLYVPVLAKIYIAESGVHFLAGPQASFFLKDTGDALNSLGVDLTFGAGYDINEHFFLDARYAFELTNRYTEDYQQFIGDSSGRFNSLNIGVGYKF